MRYPMFKFLIHGMSTPCPFANPSLNISFSNGLQKKRKAQGKTVEVETVVRAENWMGTWSNPSRSTSFV